MDNSWIAVIAFFYFWFLHKNCHIYLYISIFAQIRISFRIGQTHTTQGTGRVDPKTSSRPFCLAPNLYHHHHLPPLPSRCDSTTVLQIPATGALSLRLPLFSISHSISFPQLHPPHFLGFPWHHDHFRRRGRKSSSVSGIRSPLRGFWPGIRTIHHLFFNLFS